MICKQARVLMTRRLHEVLPAGAAQSLSSHLERCADCRAALGEETHLEAELVSALKGARLHTTARIDSTVLLGRIRDRQTTATGAGSGARAWWVPAVGLPVVAALVIGPTVRREPSPRVSSPEVAQRPEGDTGSSAPGPVPAAGPATRPQPRERRARRSCAAPAQHATIASSASSAEPAEALSDPAYLDGRDPRLQAEWMVGDGSDRQARGWHERQLPPVRDDFVHLPLPRLASADTKNPGLQRAVKEYEAKAKVVDARLFKKVTLQLKAVSLEELAAALQKQTEVRFRASRGVQDEKVTVFVKEVPARDVMRATARLFGYLWDRSGDEGAYRYDLVQDLRSQLAEEEMRSRDLHEALLALDRRMTDLAGEFQSRKRSGWAAGQIYQSLSPAEKSALAQGRELHLGLSSNQRPVPEELRRPIRENFRSLKVEGRDENGSLADDPKAYPWVSLKINASELGELTLEGTTGIMIPREKPGDAYGYSGTNRVAVGRSPSVAKPENAATNRALHSLPQFQQAVSLRPKPSCPVFAEPAAAAPDSPAAPRRRTAQPGEEEAPPHVTAADVWQAVHALSGLPIVADAYTRLHPLSAVTVEKVSLFDAVSQVGDRMGVRWKKDGDFLLARSTSFFWDKQKEVPNRHLQRWAQNRVRQGAVPFSDLLELATLSDRQLDSRRVGEAVRHCWDLEEWELLQAPLGYYSPRPYLRLLAAAPARAEQARRPEGMPLALLSPGEQQEWARELLGRLPAAWNPQAYRCRVDYVPAGSFVWVRRYSLTQGAQVRNQPVIGAPTPEEALAAARRIDPHAAPDQIRRTKGVLSVVLLDPSGAATLLAGNTPEEITD